MLICWLSQQPIQGQASPSTPNHQPLDLTAPPMALREGCEYQNLLALRGSSTGPRRMVAQVPH